MYSIAAAASIKAIPRTRLIHGSTVELRWSVILLNIKHLVESKIMAHETRPVKNAKNARVRIPKLTPAIPIRVIQNAKTTGLHELIRNPERKPFNNLGCGPMGPEGAVREIMAGFLIHCKSPKPISIVELMIAAMR